MGTQKTSESPPNSRRIINLENASLQSSIYNKNTSETVCIIDLLKTITITFAKFKLPLKTLV